MTTDAYAWLLDHSLETSYLVSTAALLHWDQRTCIPRAGHGHRTEQLARLTRLVHERTTDPKRGDMLAAAEANAPDDPQAAEAVNLCEWRRTYDRTVKIPEGLAVGLSRATSTAETAWEEARPANDWATFLPHLEEVLRLKREEAEAVGYANEPYDALLDVFEPGETAAGLEELFGALRTELRTLLDGILGSERIPPSLAALGPYDVQPQQRLVREVCEVVGFDFTAGRVDVSAHPFSTSIGPGDARITVRYKPGNLAEALYSAVHEAGHSLYEMGLPPEHWGTPCGESVSLGIHESQSRLWENMVGRSAGFCGWLLEKARPLFPSLHDMSVEDFHFAVNAVQPSLIRTEADEVTYNLHVLLRFELELALLRGDLAPSDLPGAWDEKMAELLHITPDTVADGAMQDVHWSAGLIGYFPTYTLGNVYAAQLMAAAERDLGGLDDRLAAGECGPLLGWLREKVHTRGMRRWPRDLVKEATGEEAGHERLVTYLQQKFGTLYAIGE